MNTLMNTVVPLKAEWGGGGGYLVDEGQLSSSKKSEEACLLGYDNAVR